MHVGYRWQWHEISAITVRWDQTELHALHAWSERCTLFYREMCVLTMLRRGCKKCTWPEGVPARKKSATRKDSGDGRPSTAGSSGLSEGSTPPTRDPSPPRRAPVDVGLPPLASRRAAYAPSATWDICSLLTFRTVNHTFNYIQWLRSRILAVVWSEWDFSQYRYIQLSINIDVSGTNDERGSSGSGYSHHTASNVLSMIPEVSSYPTHHPRYEHAYSNGAHPPRHAIATGVRTMGHQSVSQWNPPPIMAPVDPIGPYVCLFLSNSFEDTNIPWNSSTTCKRETWWRRILQLMINTVDTNENIWF